MKKIKNLVKIFASCSLLLTCISCAEETEDLGGAFSGARWLYAGKMTLLGLAVIFSVLAILWAALSLFRVFSEGGAKKKPASDNKDSVSEPAAAPAAAASAPSADNNELIAVISAAVAAYLGSNSEKNATGFRVVSFKRVGENAKISK